MKDLKKFDSYRYPFWYITVHNYIYKLTIIVAVLISLETVQLLRSHIYNISYIYIYNCVRKSSWESGCRASCHMRMTLATCIDACMLLYYASNTAVPTNVIPPATRLPQPLFIIFSLSLLSCMNLIANTLIYIDAGIVLSLS